MLLGYKESPVDEARRLFNGRIADLFADFFVGHRTCVTTAIGGDIDLVVPVPSSSRPGRASLEGVRGLAERTVSALSPGAVWAPWVLERSRRPIGPMRPNARAFSVPDSAWRTVRGARVLLLDDIYVSGSRAQSAAAALRFCGARDALIVPLGRVVRPERLAAHAAFIEGRSTSDGHRARCALVQAGAGRDQTGR